MVFELRLILVSSDPMVGIRVGVANSIEGLVKRYYMVISNDFGVLWFQDSKSVF